MTKLTRRSFLKQTSVSAATLMVVHVSDVATSEVTLLVGAREIVFRDPQLFARLIKATR